MVDRLADTITIGIALSVGIVALFHVVGVVRGWFRKAATRTRADGAGT